MRNPLEASATVPVEIAATYLGLSVSTLNKLRVFGGGPVYLKLGRRVAYDVADLDAWLSSKRRISTSDDGTRVRTVRLRDEADALMLLKRTLVAASLEASIRYLAPVTSRVEPYVRRLLPGASLTFGEDMSPSVLERSGRSEPADQLSMGTQEQLAVLTRVAFADLLVEKGKPASLVLDDALVFSDDVRFDTMLDILTEVSNRMQVIILTCRASLFRSVDAHKVRMSRV